MSKLGRKARDLVEKFGYRLIKLEKAKWHRFSDLPHSRIIPRATYSPWLADQDFLRARATIGDRTGIGPYRLYELWSLVREARKVPGDLLEVGTWRGGSGALIAQAARTAGFEAETFLCDTFTGVVKAGAEDTFYHGGEHEDTSRAKVEGLLAEMGLDRVTILEGIFPEETGAKIEDKTFRFCHIDVDTYQSAKDVMDWVWPRLSVGGMIVHDDMGFYFCSGITRLVEEERANEDRLVVHNLNGHGIIIKLK